MPYMCVRGKGMTGCSPDTPVRMDCREGFRNRPAKGDGPRVLCGLGPDRKRSVSVIGNVSHVNFVGNKNGTL